jgi:hypothetical protein
MRPAQGLVSGDSPSPNSWLPSGARRRVPVDAVPSLMHAIAFGPETETALAEEHLTRSSARSVRCCAKACPTGRSPASSSVNLGPAPGVRSHNTSTVTRWPRRSAGPLSLLNEIHGDPMETQAQGQGFRFSFFRRRDMITSDAF